MHNRIKSVVLEANKKAEESVRSAVSWDWERGFSPAGPELFSEVALLMRSIGYRSIVLMVHDRRVVELNKTGRICRNTT